MFRVLRIFLVVSVVGLASAAYAYTWFNEHILSTLPPDLSEYRDYRPPTACQVYAADGTRIDQFYVERRIWVPIQDLDPWTWQAFIAAEDRRFMEHGGVDLLGIARALWVNWYAGHDVQGASTLTQQLVKNLIVGKERSYERKIKEAVLAYRLEKELSKTQILELYINYVALGSGNYGVEAASQDYFGISARDLNPGQAAELAGLVPAPSRYSPRVDEETAGRRREIVLGAMVEMGFVESDLASSFLDDPVLSERDTRADKKVEAAAYVTMVRREVRSSLGDEIPFQAGLQVNTPLDRDLQKVVETAVRDVLLAHQKRQGSAGAVRNLPEEQWEDFLVRAHGLANDPATTAVFEPELDQCFEALVDEKRSLNTLRAGRYVFSLQKSDWDLLVRDPEPEQKPKPLAKMIRSGDILKVCRIEGEKPIVRLDNRPWSEGAAVVLENKTGRVLAMTGGWDVGLEGFVRATQAKRQPGSSFKPYVYATALKEGYTQVDNVLDAPIYLGGWSPKNYSPGFAGQLPMRRALAKSLNTVAVRLILDVGVTDVIQTAKDFGVTTKLRQDPTIALGSSEVTPMDQALGYATIARLGVRTEPVWIDTVANVDGKQVGAAGGAVIVGGKTVGALAGGPGKRVMAAGTAYEMADMMRGVVKSGTARKAWVADLDRAGKTGTTNNNVDAWFVGFTPAYTVAVWVGTDGQSSLGDNETGGVTALPAWLTIINSLPQTPGERFPIPGGAVLVPWQGEWVGLPRGEVPGRVLPTAKIEPGPLPAFPGTTLR